LDMPLVRELIKGKCQLRDRFRSIKSSNVRRD
jgi:hypothetical protein